MVDKPSLSDFSLAILLGEIKTNPTPEPLWFATTSTYTFQHMGPYREIASTDFSSIPCAPTSSSSEGSTNLATRSTRTWPLMEV